MRLANVYVLLILCGGAFDAATARAETQQAAAPLGKDLVQHQDHICLIGNTLAERMQHHGWLETLIQHRFPRHELTIRNLGFSGDELTLRLRSMNFGSPDDWLSRCQADVVLAFFGYNESYAGSAGLPKFKSDLEQFIRHTLSQQYNGKSRPRLVLFSPLAHEDLHDRNLPDGRENNERLALYTSAMADVARAQGVIFVDLFGPRFDQNSGAQTDITINGVHLNQFGDRLVATHIDRVLFGPPERALDYRALEPLRQSILDKNFIWFNRYRTVDGYSIFGERADLKFVAGQTNRVVMQREMEVLDVMTANRDRHVWAVAQGRDLAVDDGNTPPFIPVVTNKPGPGPKGEHVFLSGEESISKMTVHSQMQINLFASEEQFPELAKPVQMTFDARGRMWVAVMPSYPHWKPKEQMNDKILILEDVDGDGRADTCRTFADGLHVPTGLEIWNGGVLVGQQPDLVFLKDIDGDDVADVRERVLHGLDSADTHHALNSFVLDPGGALYFQEGTFHHTQVESPWLPTQRCANAGVFRYEPRTQKFDVYASYGFANPHGHVFDRWGQDFVTDGTGNVNYFAAAFSGHVEFPHKHAGMQPFFPQRTRPCPATEILSSRHFPESLQGNYLDANVIGFQGILQYKLSESGSGFAAEELEPIVSSSDPNFRPADLEMGPDGALYFLEWQNPIIGHMQHNLRDPSRDRTHGRVYRVTYRGRELLKPAQIAGASIEELLELLKSPEDRTRYRARIELNARATDAVLRAAERWVAALDRQNSEYEHHLLEALWLHQGHNVVNVQLLERMLSSPDHRARAAATRVLCYWRDRVSGALDLLKRLATDPHPRVRLEAVRAASFFTTPDAIEVPLVSAEKESDYYLEYTRNETLKTLEPYWKRALAEGHPLPIATEAGARFILGRVKLAQLMSLDKTRPVCLELLYRAGVPDDERKAAVAALAKLEGSSEISVLLSAIQRLDAASDLTDDSTVFDLVRLLSGRAASELGQTRPAIAKLALEARQAAIRQAGFAALIGIDGGTDGAWQTALASAEALRDFASAVPYISDAALRSSLYARMEGLLASLPASLQIQAKRGAGQGRFVRIELPRQGTLTLAEVEVLSEGRNVAPRGKATQKNTAHGGAAIRAIDGNRSGKYGDNGQTHTEENTDQPWWELDLGQPIAIESIVIYNRTDDRLGGRLNGFTLLVLDAERKEVFRRENLPAPQPVATTAVDGLDAAVRVRRAAMAALPSMRGQERTAFQALAKFVREDTDADAATRALLRIPPNTWPADEAPPLLACLVERIRNIPAAERTSQAAVEAIEFATALADSLPAAEAKLTRAELGELGVRVIRLATVLERMTYDKDALVVKAGKPVEFVLENLDMMPHNFVILKPGSLEEVGLLTETPAMLTGGLERQYVPESDKILLSSTLLQPRQQQKLSFQVPATPGVYPFVCTYPGHWRRMYGALYVVDDLEQYSANPEQYLADHQLEAQDALLKDRRPRTEWKYSDLAAQIEALTHGRSLGTGKQLFQVATCNACHRLDGVGNSFGPELVQLDAKLTPADILKEMLDPSAKINEKFQSHIFELDDGRTITGLIVEESADELKVIENPLAKTEPIILAKRDVLSRQKSPISLMPKGLLDKLTRDEVLDLVAYIASRGNPHHPLFDKEPHDHHAAGH